MQISAVQQLMRMEVRAPSMATVDQAWRWYLAGLGALLPSRVQHLGWRPKYLLIERGDNDGAERRRVVEQSWFGAARLVDSSEASGLPIAIALSDKNIYRTQLSLPPEAAPNLQKTVALRLDELSPIPPEDAAFAIGDTTKTNDGRINVQIAIARKKHIGALQKHYENTPLATIGAHPDDKGDLQFVFREDEKTERAKLQPLIGAAMLIAAASFFSLSIDVHLSQRLQVLENHEAEILSALRDLRPALSLFESADAAHLTKERGASAADLIAAIENRLAALPAGARIKAITINDASAQLAGFLPVGPTAGATDPQDLQRTSSDRPGFDRFAVSATIKIDAEASP